MLTIRPGMIAVCLVLSHGAAGFSQDQEKVQEKEKANLKAEKAGAGVVAFSSDGKRLVSGGSYQDFSYLWDIAGEKPIARLEGAGDLVRTAAFSGDGRIIVTTGLETSTTKTRLLIWNGLTGARINELPVDLGTSAAISPIGNVLVTSNARRMGVQFYRLPDCEQIGELHHPLPGTPEVVIVSPDGATIAVCYERGVWLGDPTTGDRKAAFEAVSPPRAMAFSPDSQLLVTAGDDGTVQCWNLAQGNLAWSQKKHNKDVSGLTIAPSGTAVASAGRDDTVRIWDLRTGEDLRVIKGRQLGVMSVAFSRDGKTLAIGHASGVALWEIQTPAPAKAVAQPKGAPRKKAKK
jgi:WD40 repeat protein